MTIPLAALTSYSPLLPFPYLPILAIFLMDSKQQGVVNDVVIRQKFASTFSISCFCSSNCLILQLSFLRYRLSRRIWANIRTRRSWTNDGSNGLQNLDSLIHDTNLTRASLPRQAWSFHWPSQNQHPETLTRASGNPKGKFTLRLLGKLKCALRATCGSLFSVAVTLPTCKQLKQSSQVRTSLLSPALFKLVTNLHMNEWSSSQPKSKDLRIQDWFRFRWFCGFPTHDPFRS